MQHISTTPEAVSKLKKAAKVIVRAGDIQHAQALDQVAKDAGYHHWKHVTACAETTSGTPSLASLTSRRCVDDRFSSTKQQDFTVITGPTGSGKSLRGIDLILNALREGKPVHVLDVGHSYDKLCRMVGGTYVTLATGQDTTEIVHGKCLLVIFELEEMVRSGVKLNALPTSSHATAETLLVVDELWQTAALVPDLPIHIRDHLCAGGSVALLSQDAITTDLVRHYLGIETPASVRRTHVTLNMPAESTVKGAPGSRTRSAARSASTERVRMRAKPNP